MNEAQTDLQTTPTYRTGVAARLAGIPVATLRVWERRYEVVGPRTSASGHRRYSAEQVSRLGLIKALVDQGHPIGSIANLPLDKLGQLREAPPSLAGAVPEAVRPVRVAIVGESLATEVASAAHLYPSLDVAGTCAGRVQAAEALRGVSADLLAIELPALREDAVALVDVLATQVGASQAIVAYRFGTQAAVRALRDRGHIVVRAPVDLAEIESLAGAALPAGDGAGASRLPAVPPPRFDDRTLAELARISTPMYCECPQHVVELLQSLSSFERYSAECENRSPADAELHRFLQRIAGTARTLFEEALVRLARAEGIPLPAQAATESAHV